MTMMVRLKLQDRKMTVKETCMQGWYMTLAKNDASRFKMI